MWLWLRGEFDVPFFPIGFPHNVQTQPRVGRRDAPRVFRVSRSDEFCPSRTEWGTWQPFRLPRMAHHAHCGFGRQVQSAVVFGHPSPDRAVLAPTYTLTLLARHLGIATERPLKKNQPHTWKTSRFHFSSLFSKAPGLTKTKRRKTG